MKSMNVPVGMGLFLACLGMGYAPSPAVAGYWQPEVQTAGTGYSPRGWATVYYNPEFQAAATTYNDAGFMVTVYGTGDYTEPAFTSGTISYRLRWVPDGPTDLPPTEVLVMHEAGVDAAATYGLASQQDKAALAALATVTVTATDMPDLQPAVTWDGGVEDIGIVNKEIRHRWGKVKLIDNKARKDIVGIDSFTARIDVSTKTLPPYTHPQYNDLGPLTYEGYGFMYYNIYPLNASLRVRRRNSGSGYGGQASIAAGGLDSDIHKSDVGLTFGNELSLNPIDISEQRAELKAKFSGYIPRLENGQGVAQDAKFEPGEDPDPNPDPYTLFLGTITSSDRASEGTSVDLEYPVMGLNQPWNQSVFYPNSTLPTASLIQQWDQFNDWKSGPIAGEPEEPGQGGGEPPVAETPGEDPVPGTFMYDKPVKLTFRPRFEVPIIGHSMKFLPEHLLVHEYNPALGIFSTHDPKDPGGLGEGLSPTTGYVTFTPEQPTDSGNGTYTSKLKVPYDALKLVHWVKPAAEDQGTYQRVDSLEP